MSLCSWFSETLTLKTYRCEWKLLSLYMFHRVIFILLIVSSLFLNLIAAQVVFSRTYNKTSHAGVLKMLRVNITWQNHKEREIKPKHNIKFSIMLKLKCSFKRLRQLGLQIWCLTKVRTRPAGRGDLGNFLIVLTKRPLLLPYISHRSRFFRLNSPSINENSLTENVL